jgi:hypothetical protein
MGGSVYTLDFLLLLASNHLTPAALTLEEGSCAKFGEQFLFSLSCQHNSKTCEL